jgi:hypothetical protein
VCFGVGAEQCWVCVLYFLAAYAKGVHSAMAFCLYIGQCMGMGGMAFAAFLAVYVFISCHTPARA